MSDTNRVGVRIARSPATSAPILNPQLTLEALRYTGAPGLAFAATPISSCRLARSIYLLNRS
jgi:hypothetical protein